MRTREALIKALMAATLQFETASGKIGWASISGVEIFLRDRAHPNALHHNKKTSLHFAVYNGTVKEVRKVIEFGA